MAQKNIITASKPQFSSAPHGNHGDNAQARTASETPKEPPRPRLTFELSPNVLLLLDHVCEVTGSTKSQVINAALLDALPALVERSDFLLKRGQALIQAQFGTAKKK